MRKSNHQQGLNIEEVRLISDLRIMHAKVYELFEIVSVIKRRHDENSIRRFADQATLGQDIKRVDEIYLWFIGLKEDGLRLTEK
jgi:hypothetical protein